MSWLEDEKVSSVILVVDFRSDMLRDWWRGGCVCPVESGEEQRNFGRKCLINLTFVGERQVRNYYQSERFSRSS